MPHLIYLAIGFPPAAKSCAYRMKATANAFCELGWDVTVVTIQEEAWERDCGLDRTLAAGVDSRVRIVELPLVREDLETDIRCFSDERALNPAKWLAELRGRERSVFPEPVFGSWRPVLEEAVLDIHHERPADLLLASCVPYVNLAAAWKLWNEHRVPYAVDFRDGWSLDVIGGTEAFSRDSDEGRWEGRVLSKAVSFWVVNEAIAGFYRNRFRQHADRVEVVPNGFDQESVPRRGRAPCLKTGLTFGYVGTVNFPSRDLERVLEAWRIARSRDELVARSRIEFRGHIGVGANRRAGRHSELLAQAACDGVSVGGSVAKSDLANLYESWDALLLILVGGRYVTSGKVYEYMATGLPIVSAHAADHDATRLLAGFPLWSGDPGWDVERIAAAFQRAARLAVGASDSQRVAARRHAGPFVRQALVQDAVKRLSALVLSGDRHEDDGTARADARMESPVAAGEFTS